MLKIPGHFEYRYRIRKRYLAILQIKTLLNNNNISSAYGNFKKGMKKTFKKIYVSLSVM